jgi:putative transcriptional regulator
MTAATPDERLVEYVLGTLPTAERRDLERELGDDLPAAVATTQEALAALSLALRPVQPPPSLRERLLAAARGPSRFAPFIDRLARLIDVAADRARDLLASLERPETWLPTPGPNVHLVHLFGGPAVAGADVGFVRVAAGTAFPLHRHTGDERVLVLQGSYRDSTGTTARPGDVITMPTGTAHELQAGPDHDLIYAVVAYGIEIAGVDMDAVWDRDG